MHEGAWSSRLGLPGTPALAEEVDGGPRHRPGPPTGARIHFLHLSTAGSVELVRAGRGRGSAGHRRGRAPPLHPDRRVRGRLRPGLQGEPAAAPGRRRDGACRRGLADGTVDAIATDHAPHAPELKELPFDQAPPGMLGLETALAAAPCGETGPRPSSRVLALLSWQPAAIAGLGRRPRRRAGRAGRRRGRPANLCVFDPDGHLDGRPGPLGQPQPQHPLRRAALTRAGAPHRLPGRAGGDRRRGAAVSGRRHRRAAAPRPEAALGAGRRRGLRGRGRRRPSRRAGWPPARSVFNTVLSRLPGGDHRPVLRRAGHRLHLPPHRQLRRQRRRTTRPPAPYCRGVDRPRPGRPARAAGGRPGPRGLPRPPRRAGHHRRGHPPADPPPPRRTGPCPAPSGRPARRRWPRPRPAAPGTDGRDLVSDGDDRRPRTSGATGPYRVVAYDFGVKETMLRQLARHGHRHRGPGVDPGRRGARPWSPTGSSSPTGRATRPPLPAPSSASRATCSGRVPVFGICLGHQLLGRRPRRRRPTSCPSATTAATTRCGGWPPAAVEIT